MSPHSGGQRLNFCWSLSGYGDSHMRIALQLSCHVLELHPVDEKVISMCLLVGYGSLTFTFTLAVFCLWAEHQCTLPSFLGDFGRGTRRCSEWGLQSAGGFQRPCEQQQLYLDWYLDWEEQPS